ncbi:unnamed protein product [marine sediment metagenome]|uniref:Sulfotransferase domain-containing protein n=1 Tax=marine sediment metagenome TaxID=412755 RepID=X0U5T2_9ZZZZ
MGEIVKAHPRFPDLSFEECLKAWETLIPAARKNREINPFMATMGQYTQKFIKFFFREPGAVIRTMNEEFITNERFREHMYDVTFLRTDRLKMGLWRFLDRIGYRKRDISFLLLRGKVQPPGAARKRGDRWRKFYTPEVKAYVRQRERMLFKLFPEFDV